MIPGINISHWQRTINWDEVKRSGVQFAFIHATEFQNRTTNLSIDPHFISNLDGVTQNNMFWGAVHIFSTHIDPVLQAKVFCEVVGDFNSLPPVLKIMEAGSKGERLNYKAKLFVETVAELSGRKPIILTNETFWQGYMCHEKESHADWAREYPLWISQYSSLWPTALYPWAAWDFWQYSDKGSIPGVETDVHMSWFNGSEKEFFQKYANQAAIGRQKSTPITVEGKHANWIADDFSPKTAHDAVPYKGDFQEDIQQFRHTGLAQGSVRTKNKKVISENDGTGQVEEWIKNYFFQPA